MRKLKILISLPVFLLSIYLYSAPSWVLVWADEFDGPNINTSYWGYDLGCSGWGNNEWENYTNSSNNAFIENGNLVIQAINTGGGNCGYTSARLKTQGKVHFTYGRIEARIKMPYGQGIWPAFWMLGENISTVGWPACGEIDIMEMVGGGAGRDNVCVGTAHWDNGGHQYNGNSISVPWPEKLADNYHIYAVEWDATSIKWFFDGTQYHTVNIGSGMEEFVGKDFFILLNLAVGGNWPGYPDASTVFPQRMYVDYVRWYQWQESGPTATPTPTPTPKIFNIPGRVEAEDYKCCEGTGYHDSDATNNGGQYRNDGVDIEVCTDTGGGYNVGWTVAGEWLSYSINVTQAGSYNIGIRVASNGAGGTFHLEIDGVNVSGTMTIPNTGGWQIWQTLNVNNINLATGNKTLKIVMDANGATGSVGNFNYIDFTVNNSPTSTPTPTIPGTKIETFEDNEFDFNNLAGAWTQWAATGSNITRSIVTDVAAGAGNYAGKIRGDVIGNNWSSISIATDLNSSGTEINLNGTQGIRLFMKGNKGSGTQVDFLIQLVSTNITDYSYWHYNYTPSSNWTFINIPWNNFSSPGWGQGMGLSLSDVLQHVKAIQFAIVDTTGGTANNTGNNWYIDEIEIYGGSIPTPTNTATATRTFTRTNTPINTNTATATFTFTRTHTPVPTNTPVNTQTDVLIPLNSGMQMTCQFINNTNGQYQNNQIYVLVIALNSNGRFCHLDSNGNMIECNPGENGSNYSIPLSSINGLQFPPTMISGRLYVSLGSPLDIPIIDIGNGQVGIVYPNIENPTDPNLNKTFDWIEFNLQNGTIFCNTTQVDIFGIPLILRLYDNFNSSYILNGEVGITHTAETIFNLWNSNVPSEFLHLLQGNRIVAPIHGNFAAGKTYSSYFDSYINSVWQQYTNNDLVINIPPKTYTGRVGGDNRLAFTTPGDPNVYYVSKPTTQDIFMGAGALASGNSVELALEAIICAGFNRHVIDDASKLNNPNEYYKSAPANFYSKFWHDVSINNKAYGFCYDDVNDQSTTLVSTNPRGMVIVIGGGTTVNLTSTPTVTKTNTPTATRTFTRTNTATNTNTPTSTNTQTNTATRTFTNTATATRTNTPTNTRTSTLTETPTNTDTTIGTPAATGTLTKTATNTSTLTNTQTPVITNTQTTTETNTVQNTYTNTVVMTNTASFTFTHTATFTATNFFTNTPVNTNSFTPTNTRTPTVFNTATSTFTFTATLSATPMYVATPVITNTPEKQGGNEIKNITIYPHPINKKEIKEIKIKFYINQIVEEMEIEIYSIGYRKIKVIKQIGITQKGDGEVNAIVAGYEINNLARGIYYYILRAILKDGSKIKSRVDKFIIL